MKIKIFDEKLKFNKLHEKFICLFLAEIVIYFQSQINLERNKEMERETEREKRGRERERERKTKEFQVILKYLKKSATTGNEK